MVESPMLSGYMYRRLVINSRAPRDMVRARGGLLAVRIEGQRV